MFKPHRGFHKPAITRDTGYISRDQLIRFIRATQAEFANQKDETVSVHFENLAEYLLNDYKGKFDAPARVFNL